MAEEVLSQNEIDALLSAISSGEMDADELKQDEKAKKVKTYDFKRALRFSKDQIRSLTRIHENFARLLTTFYSARLRTFVQISVASVDQVPYEEFIRSIPTMTILNTYSLAPLEGKILIEYDPTIAFAMLDRTLGGSGGSVNKINNLTEIETTLMTQFLESGMENLKAAWQSVEDVDPVMEEFEVNPQFIQMVSPNETVVVVTLNSTIGETSGMINICIPHVVLEPIVSKLSIHYWMQAPVDKQGNETEWRDLTTSIQKASIDLKAILGETSIQVEELMNLREGDVLMLNQPIDRPLDVKVDNQVKFKAQPGKQKNRMAIQVMEEIETGGEENE
ncbi:flagellar motor switch protein FliM [Terribacillus saccharophilus]|uniref:Flagellar motor switch protein FliM n=1 Tax=Terribacillus saccharophilus TaxID=361277 RepID=A0A075LPH4_9BACI|nr:flagellar motor switch protein FliM [Terribacillus goriensis]AIF66383.1 flagellar motor switch protein FliM [Terribacillus goriensis]MEC0283163.1 flagellar motor switch protein FliM [Terribacillus saccharophilus]MEC0290120.1 flagellar motor switch protein FliM [Terribacillus saccharophilus]